MDVLFSFASLHINPFRSASYSYYLLVRGCGGLESDPA